MKLFGFEIKKIEELEKLENPEQAPVVRSFVEPGAEDDGSKPMGFSGLAATYGYSLDIDKAMSSQSALINEYRGTAMIPDVDGAIEDITSESIVYDDDTPEPVKIVLDDVPIKPNTKGIIEEEFKYVLQLLNFPYRAHDIFKRWYIDGQINYHKLIDETNPASGIQELRYVDPRNLVKIRYYPEPERDTEYQGIKSENYIEYWLYSENGFATNTPMIVGQSNNLQGIKIAKDSIAHANSGNVDPSSKMILSHLHKSVRIARQLRMLQDSMVIYRITHSVERRVIKVGIPNGIAKGKAESYLQQFITKYKNKITYDPNTGQINDERKHWAAIENMFIPVWEGQTQTDIDTLPGADSLGVTQDVEMFQQNLLRSLNVPLSRLDPETGFALGRSNEITRDEVKYARFISRLRARFSTLFEDLLRSQLILKGIVSEEDWEAIKPLVRFEFTRDNHFTELMEAEILANRLNVLNMVQPYLGLFFSAEWAKKNILRMDDDEIEEIAEQMMAELEQRVEIQETMGVDPVTGQPLEQNDGPPPPAKKKSTPKKKKLKEEEEFDSPQEEIKPEALDTLMRMLTEESKQRIERRRNLRILPGTGNE